MSSPAQTILERALFKKVAEIIFAVLLIIVVGLLTSIIWAVLGIIFSITIIGLPLGKRCFTIAKYAVSPSKKIITYENGHKLSNILWFPVGLVLFAITFVLTAITSPFSVVFPNLRKYYKLWKMCFKPFSVIIEKQK